jgi:non-homologous end joining protein Ku
VLEAIQRKIEGQDITADVPAASDGKMVDLMEALKASLARPKPDQALEGKRKVS